MKEQKLLFGDDLKQDIDLLAQRTEKDEVIRFLLELRKNSEEKLNIARKRNPDCKYANTFIKVKCSDVVLSYVLNMASELPEKSDLKLFVENIQN